MGAKKREGRLRKQMNKLWDPRPKRKLVKKRDRTWKTFKKTDTGA